MIFVIGSTNRTGISMSTQGYLRPLALANIDHEFVPYNIFLKKAHFFAEHKCLIVPVPSAWRFTLTEKVPFISAFVCESNVIPDVEKNKLSRVSDIWVPSTFCERIVANNGLQCRYAPYSMEMPLRECTKKQSRFTFLCSFDGKFTIHRKGVLQTISIFKKTFTQNKDVCLRVKTFDLSKRNEQLIRECIDNDDRIILDTTFTDTTDEIYDDVDCYISLHASEGFGRHIAEAMLRKIPVICTNYGGNTDFCTEDTALLVGGEFVSHKYDSQYNWNGVWLYPNQIRAQHYMRNMYEGQEHVDIVKAKKTVEDLYGDMSVAKIIKQL